jgi:hypothetical protein
MSFAHVTTYTCSACVRGHHAWVLSCASGALGTPHCRPAAVLHLWSPLAAFARDRSCLPPRAVFLCVAAGHDVRAPGRCCVGRRVDGVAPTSATRTSYPPGLRIGSTALRQVVDAATVGIETFPCLAAPLALLFFRPASASRSVGPPCRAHHASPPRLLLVTSCCSATNRSHPP